MTLWGLKDDISVYYECQVQGWYTNSPEGQRKKGWVRSMHTLLDSETDRPPWSSRSIQKCPAQYPVFTNYYITCHFEINWKITEISCQMCFLACAIV